MTFYSICVKTKIWGEKCKILSAFQGIIPGLYRKLNRESRPQMHSIYVVFFHLLSAEYNGNIRSEIMQPGGKEL